MTRQTVRDLLVFTLLVGFGVAGRWAQPAWNFTPLAAVALAGGYYFRATLPAMLVPIGVLAISDILLASHVSLPVQAAVYAMMLLPVALGRLAQRSRGWRRAAWLGSAGFVPATLFFVVTNLAVWMFQSDYAATWAGLVDCYGRALPFYRNMLAGDVFFVTTLVSGYLFAALPRFIECPRLSESSPRR